MSDQPRPEKIGSSVIFHQESQGQDQREQRDSIDRVTGSQIHGQRQTEQHGHCDRHDDRFAPSQTQRQQQDDDDDRHSQRFDQFVHLLVRVEAVIAGHEQFDVGGNDFGAQPVGLFAARRDESVVVTRGRTGSNFPICRRRRRSGSRCTGVSIPDAVRPPRNRRIGRLFRPPESRNAA